MDGLRMVDEWHAFAGEMPDEQTVVFRRRGSLEEYRHSSAGTAAVAPIEAERVLMLVDGRATVRRVIDLSRLGSFEAMRDRWCSSRGRAGSSRCARAASAEPSRDRARPRAVRAPHAASR